MLYDELVNIYKKEYDQVFNSKDKDWIQKHDYKNLKDLDYRRDQSQPDQSQRDQSQPDQQVLPKWVKVTKNRFNEIWSIVTEVKKNKLKTSLDGKEFTLDDAESLLEGIINRKTNGSEAKERYNNIDDDIFIILKSKVTKNQKKNNKHFNTVRRNFCKA